MRLFVCIKQVPDTETKIKLTSDNSGIEESGIKWVMNPYDEFAVEEALKLKESQGQGQVIVVSVGPKARVVDSLRTALAMGADEAIVIDAPGPLDSHLAAQAMAAAIRKEGPFDMIFTGRQAIDGNASATGQILAELLEIPHATVVSKFNYMGESCVVEREVEGGSKEVIELKGPAVITANKGLNSPRYASLPGIMKAKKKPLKELDLESLGLNSEQIKTFFKEFKMPPEKPPVLMISGEAAQQAQELAQRLSEEAKVF